MEQSVKTSGASPSGLESLQEKFRNILRDFRQVEYDRSQQAAKDRLGDQLAELADEIIKLQQDKTEFKIAGLIREAWKRSYQSWDGTKCTAGEPKDIFMEEGLKIPEIRNLVPAIYLAFYWGGDLEQWIESLVGGTIGFDYVAKPVGGKAERVLPTDSGRD